MKVTIVVAYNKEIQLTKDFLDKMQETTKDCGIDVECVLVHGFVGHEEDIVHPFITKFTRIKNIGFCNTLNAGLKRVSIFTDYVFFVGNDSFPRAKGWLNVLVDIAETTKCPIVCPIDQRGIHKEQVKKDTPSVGFGNFYPTVAWLIRKDALDKVGLLDEDFTGAGYYSDNDWARRFCNEYGELCIAIAKDVTLDHLCSQEGKALGITNQLGIGSKTFDKKWK